MRLRLGFAAVTVVGGGTAAKSVGATAVAPSSSRTRCSMSGLTGQRPRLPLYSCTGSAWEGGIRCRSRCTRARAPMARTACWRSLRRCTRARRAWRQRSHRAAARPRAGCQGTVPRAQPHRARQLAHTSVQLDPAGGQADRAVLDGLVALQDGPSELRALERKTVRDGFGRR